MRLDEYEIDVEKLLSKWGIDIVSIFGDEINAACPWKVHKSGRNKFYINRNSGLWNCQACADKGGNLRQLILLQEDIDRGDLSDFLRSNGREVSLEDFDEHILEILYDDDEDVLSTQDLKAMRRDTRRVLKNSSRNFHGYWKRIRGFDRDTIRFWNLRADVTTKAAVTHPHVIPVTIDGLTYFYIRRARQDADVQPKYLFQRSFPRREILFGLDKAESSKLVLCEGPLDCINVWQALHKRDLLGQYSPVAIFGSRVSQEQHGLLQAYADSIILFFDDDVGGRKATEKFLKESYWQDVAQVQYQHGMAGDPGDMTGKEILKALSKSVDSLVLKIREEFANRG